MAYDYPSNVRELENILQRAVLLAEDDCIEPCHLPAGVSPETAASTGPAQFSSLTEAKRHAAEKAERDFVITCLRAVGGHISKAAKLAGIDVSNFHKIAKKHHLDPKAFKN